MSFRTICNKLHYLKRGETLQQYKNGTEAHLYTVKRKMTATPPCPLELRKTLAILELFQFHPPQTTHKWPNKALN